MWRAIVGLLFAVPLPAPFGDAEASALVVNDDGSAVLEVSVEVTGSPAAVLVRGIGPVDELPPVALAPQGDGSFAGLVELNTTIGVRLAFEYLPSGGGPSTISELFTLVELGVDPAVLLEAISPGVTSTTFAPTTEAPESAGTSDTQWGWLALAAGSAGLALLLVWLWLGRGKVDEPSGNADNTENADEIDPSASPRPEAATD